jgi:hypothetical protein
MSLTGYARTWFTAAEHGRREARLKAQFGLIAIPVKIRGFDRHHDLLQAGLVRARTALKTARKT